VLQCIAVPYCALQCIAVCCSVNTHKNSLPRKYSAANCSALQCVAVRCRALQCVTAHYSALQCVPVFCSVLQCVAVKNTHKSAWPRKFSAADENEAFVRLRQGIRRASLVERDPPPHQYHEHRRCLEQGLAVVACMVLWVICVCE